MFEMARGGGQVAVEEDRNPAELGVGRRVTRVAGQRPLDRLARQPRRFGSRTLVLVFLQAVNLGKPGPCGSVARVERDRLLIQPD